MAEASDSEEEAPLSLRCAVSLVGERTREERDAELLSQAIDLTDDAEPVLPVPPIAAPTVKLHRKATTSSAPSVHKRLADDSDDEDAPLASRTKKQRKSSHSDDEDAPLSSRRNQQRRAVPCVHADEADSSEDEAENRPLCSRAAKRAGQGASPARSKQGERNDEGATNADDAIDEEDDGLAVTIAKAVLALGEAGDHEGVLSSLGVPLTRASPCELAREPHTRWCPAGTASKFPRVPRGGSGSADLRPMTSNPAA